ncbi:aquaporin-like protein [Scenedesmus sp. NREL 46B-D3]|nr:aquaporin-like protein [Scenedesmus sp. NREL 46B-D3]
MPKIQHRGARVDADTVFANYQAITSKTFLVSLMVEFIGTMMFTFLGSTVTDKVFGPWVNGLALAVWVYSAANISGGHLNPAVTVSTLACGFYPVLHSILYVILQFSGAIFGALLVAGLVPGVYVGMGDGAPGCFDDTVIGKGLTHSQLFGWEPGHGSFTPLAVGLSLVACAGAGGQWTGAALNPARVVGPLAVFKCGRNVAYIYILAHMLAAVLACSIFAFVSGWGPLSPLQSTKRLCIPWKQAVVMWVTGSPPKRLTHANGEQTINDVLATHPVGKCAADVRGEPGKDQA